MKRKLNPVDRYVALVCLGVLSISMASMIKGIYEQKTIVTKNKEIELKHAQDEFKKIKIWRAHHDAQLSMMRTILKELKKNPSIDSI